LVVETQSWSPVTSALLGVLKLTVILPLPPVARPPVGSSRSTSGPAATTPETVVQAETDPGSTDQTLMS
jgi:hypothetical protein